MKQEFEFIKKGIVESIKDNFGIDVSEEISFDEVALETDESVSVETSLAYDGKEASVTISRVMTNEDFEDVYQLRIFFGSGCTDVEKANKAMDKYDRTEIAKVLEIENCVDSTDDILCLSATFICDDFSSYKGELNKVFGIMQHEFKSKPLKELLQYFE